MPSYMPTHMPRVGKLPLTPPDIWGQYPSSSSGFCATTSSFYPYSNSESRYNMEPHDKFGYGKMAPMQYEQYSELPQVSAPHCSGNNSRQEYGYGAIGAPILPPIRIPENMMEKPAQRQSMTVANHAIQERPKEEKVAGGVAAELDYEMEQMVDFMAESAQGLYDFFSHRVWLADIDVAQSVQPTAPVTSEFRKYVLQILTSTRLPSSTILLALHYLAARMTLLQNESVYTSSTGHVYHMMTVALMIASKFLDDNTFQNRSWAEVSHIPVTELNKQEREWLADISWDLHPTKHEPHALFSWRGRWDRYHAKKVISSMEALKISPVDPVRMQYPTPHYAPETPVYTPTFRESDFSSSAVRDRAHQPWQQWQPVRTISPPSTGPSGITTPQWYKQNMMGFNQHSMAYSNRPLPPPQILPSNHSPFYGGYAQQYTPSPWNGHGAGCGCAYCALTHERYPLASNYGMQTVMG